MSSADPVVRLARPSDGRRCNDFYNTYYGRARTLQQWEWEFCKYVLDDGTIPFTVAECNDEVVGTQALIPLELVDTQGSYWSAKSEETLIAASMRGRGLLHQLYAPLLAVAQNRRFESIWGFTPASKAFEREGFACPTRTAQLLRCFTAGALSDLLAHTAPSQPRALLQRLGSNALAAYAGTVALAAPRRLPAALRVAVLDEAPPWADSLSLRFAQDWGGTTLHRSRGYMRWRFFENPFRRPVILSAHMVDEPVGWIAFGVGTRGTAAIVDILVARTGHPGDAKRVVAALVREATRRARDMGASAIRAWDVTKHPFSVLVRSVVRGLGWLRVERGFDMVLKFTPGITPRSDASPIDRWYVTRGFTEGSDV